MTPPSPLEERDTRAEPHAKLAPSPTGLAETALFTGPQPSPRQAAGLPVATARTGCGPVRFSDSAHQTRFSQRRGDSDPAVQRAGAGGGRQLRAGWRRNRGLKVLEAMAAGCPIVTTSNGDEGLEVSEGTGLCVGDLPATFADRVHTVSGAADSLYENLLSASG